MPKTMHTQDDYDLLIEFCDWFRGLYLNDNPSGLEYDTNDEIVQRFLTETD